MIKLIDTETITFEMEQAYMLNRGARRCIRGILEAAPEVGMQDCVTLRKPLEPHFCEITGYEVRK